METGRAIEERALLIAAKRLGPLWQRSLPGIAGISVVAIGCITWSIFNFGSLHMPGSMRVELE